MYNFLWCAFFIVFIIACVCAPVLLVAAIAFLFNKEKRKFIKILALFFSCVLIFVVYISPIYSKARFSPATIEKLYDIEVLLANEDVWIEETDGSYTCYWNTDTSNVCMYIYPQEETLVNSVDELYVDRTLSFILLGSEEKSANSHIAISPQETLRDGLEIIPDGNHFEIEILHNGMIFSVYLNIMDLTMKEDIAINEFLSDLSGQTRYGQFDTFESTDNFLS